MNFWYLRILFILVILEETLLEGSGKRTSCGSQCNFPWIESKTRKVLDLK